PRVRRRIQPGHARTGPVLKVRHGRVNRVERRIIQTPPRLHPVLVPRRDRLTLTPPTRRTNIPPPHVPLVHINTAVYDLAGKHRVRPARLRHTLKLSDAETLQRGPPARHTRVVVRRTHRSEVVPVRVLL